MKKKAVQDQWGYEHPISEVKRIIQKLRRQRDSITQSAISDDKRQKYLESIDAAIDKREELIKGILDEPGNYS